MRKNILISVIVPVYNSEEYLADCLDSILAYRGDEIEIIIINDGSSDNSEAICRAYEKEDRRIRYFFKKNGGVSSARNLGVKKAEGKYVMFIDSDDKLASGWAEKVLKNAAGDEDFVIFSKKINSSMSKTEMIYGILGVRYHGSYLSSPCSKIYKRVFLLKSNIFFKTDIINGEDMLFNVRVALLAKNTSVISFDYYDYRQILGSATKRYDENFIASDLVFHNELDSLLANNREYDFACRYSWQNAVITMARRLSFARKYKYVKKYFKELGVGVYRDVLLGECIMPGRPKMIFYLLRKRLYFLVYIILKFNNSLNRSAAGDRMVRI